MMRCAWSSSWALSATFAGLAWSGAHWSPPRPPSDVDTIPRCMSITGKNSGAPDGHPVPADHDTPVGAPDGSRHRGFTRRVRKSGTASASSVCLSLMVAELSITNRMSSLRDPCVGTGVAPARTIAPTAPPASERAPLSEAPHAAAPRTSAQPSTLVDVQRGLIASSPRLRSVALEVHGRSERRLVAREEDCLRTCARGGPGRVAPPEAPVLGCGARAGRVERLGVLLRRELRQGAHALPSRIVPGDAPTRRLPGHLCCAAE